MLAKLKNEKLLEVQRVNEDYLFTLYTKDGKKETNGYTAYRDLSMYPGKDEISYVLEWCLDMPDETYEILDVPTMKEFLSKKTHEKRIVAEFSVDENKLKETGGTLEGEFAWCEESGLHLISTAKKAPLILGETKDLDELEEEYCLCVSEGKYVLDGDMERLFFDSDISFRTINKVTDWFYNDNGDVDGKDIKEGDVLETIILVQNGKEFICRVYAQDSGCGLDYALDLTHVKELGNTWVIESCESEIGKEYFLLYVPKAVCIPEIEKILEMAAKYAVMWEEDDGEEYDDHLDVMQKWMEASGQFRFNHYIRYCIGWEIEPMQYDFTYMW